MTLTTLRVRDLATIADVTLDLGPGLNVLTGETGAGKSMLSDALALLLGDRADRAIIRSGASRTIVEGVFDAVSPGTRELLDQHGVDADDALVIRREVTRERRSRAWINGSPTTVGVLATIGESLVDLHGQHQTVALLESATQRALLDAYGHTDAARAQVSAAHRDVVEFRREAGELADRRDAAQRRADWLQYVVHEIDAAQLHAGEDDALERDIRRLAQAGTLSEQAQRIVAALDDEESGARVALGRADRALRAIERTDADQLDWRLQLDAAYLALDDLARRATDYLEGIADDPERLAQLEARRERIAELRRKHGATVADILTTRDTAQRELVLIDTADADLRGLAARIAVAEQLLAEHARVLTQERTAAAARLAREVSRLLPPLGIADGQFDVEITALDEIASDGVDRVTLVVRLNRGLDAGPLARTASGGELSRIMLALKAVLARQDAVPTLVFDEIDQGVGGEVGGRIGETLAQLATRHQVLVLTHLPQIAARADRHLRVSKATQEGRATSDVAVLHGEDRVLELARMLGDAESDAARRLAQALLNEKISA
jgi:DNA repair protein RecN (Recombination protein N)